MKKTALFIVIFTLLGAPLVFSQPQILNNNTSTLAPPVKTNLYYNNQEESGYIFQSNGEPFLLVDSAKSLFNFNDMQSTDGGQYLVNGRGVDTYYYGNNLYLDLNDLCCAIGIIPRYSNNGVIFVSAHDTSYTLANLQNPQITLTVKNIASGNNQDPINNMSWIYTVSLTNQTNSLVAINHFNVILLGESGNKYVSVKDVSYGVVWGGNDTPDMLMLDPGREHVINYTFDLPDNDRPKTLIIFKNQVVLGAVSVQ